MAHHGYEAFNPHSDNSEFRKLFEQPEQDRTAERQEKQNRLSDLLDNAAKEEGLGATGKYPEGKINEHDEGEIRIGIAAYQGKVVINFGKPISWIGLTKEQAIQIAGSLLDKSAEL